MSSEDPVPKESVPEKWRPRARRDCHLPATGGRHDTKSEPRRQTFQAENTRRRSSAHPGEWSRCTHRIRHLPVRAFDYGRDKIPNLPCSMTSGKESIRDLQEACTDVT